MAQGDPWNVMGEGTVAGNSTNEHTILPASGVKVCVTGGAMSVNDLGTSGAMVLAAWDDANATYYGQNHPNTSNDTLWMDVDGGGDIQFGGGDHGVQNVYLDDTYALHIRVQNSQCSSQGYAYHFSGQEVL